MVRKKRPRTIRLAGTNLELPMAIALKIGPPRPTEDGPVGWMAMCSALTTLRLRCEPSTKRPSTGS